VLKLTLARQATVERLVALLVAVSTALEKGAAFLRQHHRVIAIAGHPGGLDQTLFAKVSQVARARVRRAAFVAAKITTGDNSEGTNGSHRSRLRASQGVLPVAVADQLSLWPTWQPDVSRERVPDIAIAFSTVALALSPAGIMIAVPSVAIDPCRSFPGPRPSVRASSLSSRVHVLGWLQSLPRS
jgi:hypothetical protein